MWGAVKAAFHDFVPIVMLASSLETSALNPKPWGFLEASKGGIMVGRIKDPLDKASYFGITPPTFIPPSEALRFEIYNRGSGFLDPFWRLRRVAF